MSWSLVTCSAGNRLGIRGISFEYIQRHVAAIRMTTSHRNVLLEPFGVCRSVARHSAVKTGCFLEGRDYLK